MNRKLFAHHLLSLLVLSLPFANLAARNHYDDISYRSWSQGPLTFQDFQIRYTPQDSREISHLSASIIPYTYLETNANLDYPIIVFTTVMDSNKSWYDPDRCNDLTLRYEQTRFNILEVYSRRMQNAFAAYPLERNRLNDYYDRLVSSTLDRFEMESDFGSDPIVVERYEQQYLNELDIVNVLPIQIPVLNLANWGFGLLIGIDHSRFGIPVSEGISSSTGISVGFEYMYKKLNIFIWGAFNSAKELKCDNFYYDEDYLYSWNKGDAVGVMVSSLNLGYKLFDKPYFSVTPFVGLGCYYIYDNPTFRSYFSSDLDRPDVISSAGLQGGLIVDWKIKRGLSFSSYDESKLRFQIFASRNKYDKLNASDYTLNMSVSYCFEFWGFSK